MNVPAPFLRWAGGKRQLLPSLTAALPKTFDLTKNRFYEPFIGGGAFYFSLAQHPSATKLKPNVKRLVINDTNPDLIVTYQTIKNNVGQLLETLEELGSHISETDYYTIRDQNPTDPVEVAARFIYLNRLSFNGLWRVNRSGRYNVPYGKLKNPTLAQPQMLKACSTWLAHTDIRHGSYTTALHDVKPGDVVYLDPPYIPITKTSNFTGYNKDGFNVFDQWGLAGVIEGLNANGVYVILSNSNTPETHNIFARVLHLEPVTARRSVGATKNTRKNVSEIIGTPHNPTAL